MRDGRIARIDVFEPDDEVAMLARFEALRTETDSVRLATGVDPAHPMVALARRIAERFDARDWSAYRELYDPGFVAIDRRRLGWGHALDIEWLMETNRSTVELYPDYRQRSEVVAVADDLFVRVMEFQGHTTEGGGSVEVSFGVLAICQDGRIICDEFFDAEDRAAMLARFEELRAQAAATPELRAERENLAVIGHRRGDYASDAVVVDHRPPDAALAPGDVPLLATRGERLALFGDEGTRMLIQSDADGRIWRTDLYVAEEDAAAREALRLLGDLDAQDNAILAGFKAGDYETYRATLADDFFHEYNPAGQRFAGRDAMIDYLRKTFRLGAEDNGEVDRHATVAPGVATRRCRWFGSNHRTGADREVIVYDVFTFDAGLRHTRLETFLPGDPRFDEALARLAGAAART